MNNDRLALAQVALLLAYAVGMAGGQLLFKASALRYAADAPPGERILSLVHNVYFLAYPFVAVAFAVTPLLGGLVFGEAITTRLLFGIALILCGLLLVAG